MTKIICCSDTHSQNLTTKWDWPLGDIWIHAGDLSATGSEESLKQVGRQIHQLPYRYKIIIAGNHDRAFWEHNKYVPTAWRYFPGVIVLEDEWVKIMGLKIYGSSWIKFKEGKYPFEIQDLKEKWDLVPDHTDVLVTHMPPKLAQLDVNHHGESMGSHSLLEATKRVRPKLHVFGHIHEGAGVYVENDITYVNACLTGRDRKPAYNPVEIEL